MYLAILTFLSFVFLSVLVTTTVVIPQALRKRVVGQCELSFGVLEQVIRFVLALSSFSLCILPCPL